MQLRENIYAVGAKDPDLRIFHGFATHLGTTYNAYLVLDEKVTLIDFVKAPFAEELLANIRAVLGERPVDCLICNHVEPDHSGALPAVTAAYPEAKVYGTLAAEKELRALYPDTVYPFVPVKAGDTLHTGAYTFHFVPMPMVHWPDSMATYLPEEKILFSNDALGQHIGTGELFDSELPLETLLKEAGAYYANIVLPFGAPVKKVLTAAAGLDIDMVCPSHGLILRDYIPQMLACYSRWCENGTDENRVVIVYDTVWGATEKLARKLAAEWAEKGFAVEALKLPETPISDVMTRLLEAKYIFVGSPTLNNNMLPTVAAFLTAMRGLKPKGRVGLAFGAYGWSGEAAGQIQDILTACGFETLEPIKVQWNI
ncbi:MAG: FprA family A-type flavoprotein [Clostridiales bacterium]|nr:FprA family A-type flavoprotein [Clostridiales bacterium]